MRAGNGPTALVFTAVCSSNWKLLEGEQPGLHHRPTGGVIHWSYTLLKAVFDVTYSPISLQVVSNQC